MYKNSTDKKIPQFPCDFCNMNECPLDGENVQQLILKVFSKP